MKKSAIILILITAMFICIGIGTFIGRNSAQSMPVSENPDFDRTKPNRVDTLFDQPEFIDGKLNINVASVENLSKLPGIGDGLARNIIKYRQTVGPFTSVEELRMVDGMGENRLSAIKDLVTVYD